MWPKVDDAFVQQAASDAETEDALPLLAFALRQLWDQLDKNFSLQAYKALGDKATNLTPLEDAVRKAADRVLAEAKPTHEELTALREAFVPALVRVNDQGEYVRRPARMDVLPAKSHALLEQLAKERLLIIRQDDDARAAEVAHDARVAEVAHEALLRKWPWLREWLDAERVFLIGKQQLEQDLQDWQDASDKDKAAALLTGLKLTRARAWLVEHPMRLTNEERDFIQASIEREEAEKRSREKTRRLLTWGSIAASIVLAIVAWVAVLQRSEAVTTRGKALLAQSQYLADLALKEIDQKNPVTAMLLNIEALPDAASEDALTRNRDPWGPAEFNLAAAQPLLREKAVLKGHTKGVTSVAISRDGTRIVTGSEDNTARVWDAKTFAELGRLAGHTGAVYSVAFSPDGARIVTGSADNTARVWDAKTFAELGRLKRHTGAVWSVAFSPDGARIVTGAADNTARVWDANTFAELGRLTGHTGAVYSVAFSTDGHRIVTGLGDKTAQVSEIYQGGRQALIEHAKAIIPRCLTAEQRQQYHLELAPPGWCKSTQKWPYDDVTVSNTAVAAPRDIGAATDPAGQ
jgi:WD domain, G-beta repeat